MFTEIFKFGKWTVSINQYRTELKFDNRFTTCYAYLDREKGNFRFDRDVAPEYIVEKALKWATRDGNMVSIYSDNI